MSDKSVFESAPRALYTAGILILILCAGDLSENKLIGVLIAYGFILVGMLIFSTLLFQNGLSIMSIGPFVMFMVLIVVLQSLISPNFNKIVQGHVSSSFSNMMNLLSMLVMVILYVSNMATTSDDFKKTGVLNPQYGAAMYFMNILLSVILVTIYIVLFIYPTDGFVSMSGV